MSIKRITAIVPLEIVTPLEAHLRECGVPGVTVEQVKGYGKHPNYFRRDLMKNNVRVVLYTEDDQVDRIVDAITACARECGARAGILAVESIERLVALSSGSDVNRPSKPTEGEEHA